MADSDEIFLALDGELEASAERIAEVLGLEPNGGFLDWSREWSYTLGARSFDGKIGVYIGLNDFLPEPGEAQAMDGYAVAVDVQVRHRKDAQEAETRGVFEALIAGFPEAPTLLSHNVTHLVAAYLPGAGTFTFAPRTTLDDPDIDVWKPWVIGG
ncbi:hypothetical protein E1263_14535 [Kribbella antibiotica]|uniref:Uncharacterized protein n=1 Tax=Kribbella antibiotica TaxID=190195 RepID=A0A4R4ZLC2_9ACTN|nr:hypothetical protein [Kribbella antibiotica]TDD59563.1 hypothetical protein E1263_14535 [Kribbella antibiotica]